MASPPLIDSVTILAAICGYAAGFIADLGKDYFRDRARRREEHAKLVRVEVLGPILELLDNYYVPATAFAYSILEIGTEEIWERVKTISDSAYQGTRYAITIADPIREPDGPLRTRRYWKPSNPYLALYGCARARHYEALLTDWESFRRDYERVAATCLQHAVKVGKDLRASLNLPEKPQNELGCWADYNHIALLVIERGLGRSGAALYEPHSPEFFITTTGTQNRVVRCDSQEQRTSIFRAIDQLANTQDDLSTVRSLLEALSKRATDLAQRFRVEIAAIRQVRGCDLI